MKDRQKRGARKSGFFAGGIMVLLLVVAATALALFFKDSVLNYLFPQAEVAETGRQVAATAWHGRRNIYDRNFRPLAVSYQLASLYARPLDLSEPERAANQLAPLLGWQEDALARELKSNRGFTWLASRLPAETAEKVQALGLAGIHRVDEPLRYYPQRDTAAHVVGFQQDDQGLAGMESYYDTVLRSEARAESVPAAGSVTKPGGVGAGAGHVVLSLNLRIQAALEKCLDTLRQQTTATLAMGLIMDPRNGEILAMAIRPAYDPNNFWEVDEARRRNELLAAPVFPGELTRIFRLGAALETGVVNLAEGRQESATPREVVADQAPQKISESGTTPSPEAEAREWYGVQPGLFVSREVAQLADQAITREALAGFATKLGFASPSAMDLPPEEKRDAGGAEAFRLDSRDQPTDAFTLLTAFGRLVNGGLAVKPHLLRAFWPDSSADAELVAVESPALLDQRVSVGLQEHLSRAGAKGAGDFLFFESLRGEDDSLAGQDEALAGLEDEAPAEAVKKFQWVMLGMAPRHEPELVLLIVLDGAAFDPTMPSLVRRSVHADMGKILEEHRQPPLSAESARLAAEKAKVFEVWRKLREKAPGQTSPVAQAQVEQKKMPEVVGLSLRKALQRLQPCGVHITVTGAGRVTRQHPPAGAVLEKGVCTLELQAEQ